MASGVKVILPPNVARFRSEQAASPDLAFPRRLDITKTDQNRYFREVKMAHKKGQGSSRNGRDSNAQRRGVKKFGSERVVAGNILIRQVGNKWHPGKGVGQGKDYTLFALIDGQVMFDRKGRRINVVAETN